MSSEIVVAPPPPLAIRRRRLSALSRTAQVGLAALALLTLVALLAPWIAPHSPSLPAGSPLQHPSRAFPLGTDEVGRDVLSRVLYGIRSTWFSAVAVVASGLLIGGAIGLAAGAAGGMVDGILMRTTDAFLALPGPVLAIAVVAALGPSLAHTLIAVAIVWWPFYARIVRAEIQALAVRPHVEAARLAGVSRMRVALRHLMPGAIPVALVAASLDIGNLILTLAALSFLGLGAPAPAPELGAMAARGLPELLTAWWIPVMPALAVFGIALLANLAGDALRDSVREA